MSSLSAVWAVGSAMNTYTTTRAAADITAPNQNAECSPPTWGYKPGQQVTQPHPATVVRDNIATAEPGRSVGRASRAVAMVNGVKPNPTP